MVTMAPPSPVAPMLATSGPVPTGGGGGGYAFEWKWDGVRAVVGVADGLVRAHSRNGREITHSYPELAVLAELVDRPVLLDGELVAVDDAGRPDFGLLQERMHVQRPSGPLLTRVPVQFYAFDLLIHGDRDVMREPYLERRDRLTDLGLESDPRVRVSRHYTDVDGADLLDIAREHGLEGIIAKNVASRYYPGTRSRSWIKTPVVSTQEVIVCGWTGGKGRRSASFGSLLLGIHTEDGLVYCGHVGTGFTDRAVREMRRRLDEIGRERSPFDSPVPREHARDAHWVDPVLVGEVEFRQWTSDGILRAPSWRGLRSDKNPSDVRAGQARPSA